MRGRQSVAMVPSTSPVDPSSPPEDPEIAAPSDSAPRRLLSRPPQHLLSLSLHISLSSFWPLSSVRTTGSSSVAAKRNRSRLPKEETFAFFLSSLFLNENSAPLRRNRGSWMRNNTSYSVDVVGNRGLGTEFRTRVLGW